MLQSSVLPISVNLSATSSDDPGSPQHTNQQLIPIYTEWANHHLAKTNAKPINDLTSDLCHPKRLVGLILAITCDSRAASRENLVCALNSTDPVESIEKCLKYLTGLGVNVSSIQAKDIRKGHLGAILSLLFSLSYFKQQQKAALRLTAPSTPSTATKLQEPKTVNQASTASPSKCKRTKKTTAENKKPQSCSSGYSSFNYEAIEQSQKDDLATDVEIVVTQCAQKHNQYIKKDKREAAQSKKSVGFKKVAFRMPPNSSSTIVSESSHHNMDKINAMEESRTSTTCVVGSSTSLRLPSSIVQPSITGRSGLISKASRLAAPSSFGAIRAQPVLIPPKSATSQDKDQAPPSLLVSKPVSLPVSAQVLHGSVQPTSQSRQISRLPATLRSVGPGTADKAEDVGALQKEASDPNNFKAELVSSTSQLNAPVPNEASAKVRATSQLAQRCGSRIKVVSARTSSLRPPSSSRSPQTSIENIQSTAQLPETLSNESARVNCSTTAVSSAVPAVSAGITEPKQAEQPSVVEVVNMHKLKLFGGKEGGAKKPMSGLQPPSSSTTKSKLLGAAVKDTTDKEANTTMEFKLSGKQALSTESATTNQFNSKTVESESKLVQKKRAISSPQLVRKTRLMQPSSVACTINNNSIDKQGVTRKTLMPPCSVATTSIASTSTPSLLATSTTNKLSTSEVSHSSISSPSSTSSNSLNATSSISTTSAPPPSLDQSSSCSSTSSVGAQCEDKQKYQNSRLKKKLQKPISRKSAPTQTSKSNEEVYATRCSEAQESSKMVSETARSTGRDEILIKNEEISPQQEKRPVLAVKGISVQIQQRKTEMEGELPRPEQMLTGTRQKQLNISLNTAHASTTQVDAEQMMETKSKIGIVSPMLQKPVEPGFVKQAEITDKAEEEITQDPCAELPLKIEKTGASKIAKVSQVKLKNGSETILGAKESVLDADQREQCSPVPPPPVLSMALQRNSKAEETASLVSKMPEVGGGPRHGRSRNEYNPDNYEDSSSISSGVSETFDDISTDDLTGSSSDYLPGVNNPSSAHNMAVFREVNNKTAAHQMNPYAAANERLAGNQAHQRDHHRLSNGQQHQNSVDELLQRCRTSQRGVSFYSDAQGQTRRPASSSNTNSRQLHPVDYYQQLQHQRAFDPTFSRQHYHTIHVPSNNAPKEMMSVNSNKGNYGRSNYRRQQAPHSTQQQYMNPAQDGNKGHNEDLYHHRQSPTIAYHTHSLDRHSHLKIFSLPSTSSNGVAGKGEMLLSAPSSPYRLPIHNTLMHPADRHNMMLGPGYALADQTGVRHSVSAAANNNKSYKREAQLRSDQHKEQQPPNGNGMTRSMVLLQETQKQQNGNHLDQRSPSGSLRRTSPHLARRAPLSVAQQPMNSCYVFPPPPLPLRSTNNNSSEGIRRLKNGSMSARGTSDEPSMHHHSASSSIYANHSGLHLHKLSSSQPSNDLITVSTHSSPASTTHLRDNNIYLNFKSPNSHGAKTAYPSMEEKYTMEMRKLLHEMDSYRSTILQLSAKHEDYNHLIQMFDGKLGLMVRHVEKLQQKSQFKQEEIDKLRQQIEHLRLMSCNAGLNLPPTQSNGGIGHFDGAGEQLLMRRPTSPSESVVSHRSAASDMSIMSNANKIPRIALPLLNSSNGSTSNNSSTKKEVDTVSARTGKKSWKSNVDTQIRSSFNKAFHKAASGSNGKKSKLNPPTNGSVSDIEHSPIHSARLSGRNGSNMESAASTTRLENVDPNTLIPLVQMVELKKQLEDKDLALTDVRLDALDKAREVDILRETVHRLKNENKILKHNFTVLERRIREPFRDDSRASSHQSLSTCCQDEVSEQQYEMAGGSCTASGSASVKGSTSGFTATHSVAESRCHSSSSSSKRSSGGVNIRVTLCMDLSGKLDFGQHTINNIGSSIANSSSASPHVGGSSSTISSTASFASSNASNAVSNNKRELTIGYLGMSSMQDFTWKMIDPDMTLGVDSYSSIIGYQLLGSRGPPEVVLRARGSDVEASAPLEAPEKVLSTTAVIKLRLQGAVQDSMDALVLESLFPKSTLEQLMHSLLQSRRLVIYGATGIGKSNLARFLAKYLAEHIKIESRNVADFRFPDDDKDSRVQQVHQQLIAALKMEKREQQILLLDNIQRKRIDLMTAAFVAADQCDDSNDHGQPNFSPDIQEAVASKKPFVIVTLNRTSENPVQNLQLHHGFKLFSLNSKMDAVKGYMGRYLRRRIAEEELTGASAHRSLTTNSSNSEQLQCVIEFLNKVLNVVNDFIEKANAFDVTLGPRIFLQCPLNMEDSRIWFIELWNDKIVPYMTKVARDSMNFLGSRGILKDPTLYVCEHWPWFDADSGAKALRHILPMIDPSHESSDSVRQNVGKQHRRHGSIASNTAIFPAATPADFDPIYALERIEESRKI
uniref:Calponin-homology (CH) domain-containing protein n=1 Tax=Ditylenchus dipsaci TaxID=166011 RepID=A0A915D7K2_9BILA